MSSRSALFARILTITGLLAMIAGALDPLEGSLVIVAGLALVAIGAAMTHSSHRPLIYWSLALAAAGVGALWGLSALGGFGGASGRSYWWGLLLVPYPVGWISGLVGAIRKMREGFGRAAA